MKRMIRSSRTWMMKLMGLPTCEEIEQFAYSYLEEELQLEQKRKFERHLRGCRNCQRFIHTYRQVARPERLLQKIPLDPCFESRVVQYLRENH
ncbi:MAG: zf-HC2 domain-containing protein [Acidobacteria bacterium]|nr:zf-HC2 domain-containing protein [Acidobacteriota bacterium]